MRRSSSLLQRGRTPPPRRLKSSVPATSPSLRARRQEHDSCSSRGLGLNSTSTQSTTPHLCSAFNRPLIQVTPVAAEHASTLLLRSSSPTVRDAAVDDEAVVLDSTRAVVRTALRSSTCAITRRAGNLRAASAPLCVSARCVSHDARTNVVSTQDTPGGGEDEEVHTSFGSNDLAAASSNSTAAATTMHRTQGGTQRTQQRHTPSSSSSAQLLERGMSHSRGSGPHLSKHNASAPSLSAARSTSESRAVLSARLMRRHRLHAALPYLGITSGAEVPGCGGGAYHLQERLDPRAAAPGSAMMRAYASRVRSGGNNIRMNTTAFTRSAISAATTAHASPHVQPHDASYTRTRDYEPFERLFRRFVERGYVVGAVPRLLHHPDAPAPAVLLDRILHHRVPAPSFVSQALLATTHAARSDRSTSASASFALQRVATRLRTDATCRILYDTPDIRVLLLEAALHEALFDEVMELIQDTPAEWITPHAWSVLVQAAGQSKLPHSQILWRLLSVRDGAAESMGGSVNPALMQRVLTRAGESALLRRVPLCPPYNPVSAGTAPAAPPSSSSLEGNDATTAGTTTSSSPSTTRSPPPVRSALPPSELPIAAAPIPDSILDARACGTVLMPTYTTIGAPLLSSSADAPASAAARHGGGKAASSTEDVESGTAPVASAAAPPSPSMPTSSALVPSVFSTGGLRWCAMGPVEVGYAAEHYNGDAAGAAGDFRAAGAAGVLHGFPSFQSLFTQIEAAVRETSSSSSTAAASSLSSRNARRALWETTALRMLHQQHGIVYGLDATTTARVLLRCGVGFSAQASPALALHVLRRYLRSCHLLRDEIVRAQELIEAQLDAADAGQLDTSTSTEGIQETSSTVTTTTAVAPVPQRRSAQELLELYPRLSRAVAPHPSPFLVFFKVMREAREVLSNAVEEEAAAAASSSGGGAGTSTGAGRSRAGFRANASLPMVHWELVWHTFQQLNRENPQWFTQLPAQEAGDLCHDVIEVLCHGADPWLTLNIARRVSVRHIVDGVEMSLWLLHRLDPSHHTEEAREVARKLFRWLLVDVGLHLQSSLHHHLIPAARALIRLNLQDELRVLYSAVLDNVYLFRAEHRDSFIQVLSDLICPACASILPESDVYVDRACPNCMSVVPAKDADTIPSFRLSAEHVERLRARRKQQRQRTRQRLNASVHRLQSEEKSGESGWQGQHWRSQQQHQQQLRGPQDAADVLRRHLQRGKADGADTEGEATLTALLLSDAAAADITLVPGVSVSSGHALFPVAGGGGAPVLDVRAAMEESSRRLELQRAARRYALAQRGETEDGYGEGSSSNSGIRALTHHTPAAMPTKLPISAQALDAATLKYLSTAANASAACNASAINAASDGVWVCVWCQETNTEWSSRVRCSACGAETGPAAPWRHFAYADPVSGDVMSELRGRMSNCEERPVDAIVAGYLLMVYRRTFQLRATPADHERLQRLVAMLCRLQERVLAGYVYTRLVPLTQRQPGALLDLLAQTYGQENASSYRALTQEDVLRPEREGVFFEAVFGPQTCRVCFGAHDWHRCPIVTRDFAGSSGSGSAQQQQQQQRYSPISLSPEEKQRAVLERLAQRIHQAMQSTAKAPTPSSAARPNAQLVVDAYTAFVSSPFREIFAELHADDTNQLSMLLSRIQQYRRAAFVLCHIPLAARATEAYLKLVHFFNVTEEEALTLLAKTPQQPSNANGTSAPASAATPIPNFIQVTKTCCMCLDQRHASHECPRLEEWLKGVQRLAAVAASSHAAATTASSALADSAGEARLRQRLRAQVDGWTTAGPERLFAFHRYLAAHMELLRPSPELAAESGSGLHRRVDFSDPLVYAVNKAVVKLAAQERRSEAYRLYAHVPVECVSIATTTAVLRMNGFAEDSIRALLKTEEGEAVEASVTSGSTAVEANVWAKARSGSGSSMAAGLSGNCQHAPLDARAAAVPVQRCCLLCFSPSHAFVDCPELAAAATEVDRLLLVVREVGGISCVHDGIGAAAAYVYSEYNRGRLSGELMRANPALVTALLTLARRCFATRQLHHGVRVLRRIPVEMTPPNTAYADLWRAAGLPEEEVDRKQSQLLALLDTEGLTPHIDPPPPRPTYTNNFLSQLSRTLHDGLCRHCYEHGHTIATCPLFHAEVSFGRDYVAAYRMSMMSEQLDRAWQEAYLLKLVDFFATHYLFMPYHIAGVANALNAITAMWSFRGEPGIALRHLLLIPAAYRRRQAFKHVLHCLRVPSSEITRLLGDFHFAPDHVGASAGSNSANPQQQQEAMMAQHLLIPKPAIRDVARRQVFEQVPAAMAALAESAERMAQIRESHERRCCSPASSSASGISGSSGGGGGGTGISAHIQHALHQQQQHTAPASGVAASSFHSPVLSRVMQSGDMARLREEFDPILAELEDAVGMRLGSRHTLFTSAMDILGAAAATAPPATASAAAARDTRTSPEGGVPPPTAATSVDANAHTVPEAEVVMEVQTRTAKSTSSSASRSAPASARHQRTAPTRPAHPPPRSRPDTRPRPAQTPAADAKLKTASRPVTFTPAATSTTTKAAVDPPRAASRVHDDEVQSSFHASTSRPSPANQQQQQQQQQQRQKAPFHRSGGGGNQRSAHNRQSSRSSSSGNGNVSNSGSTHRSNAPPRSQNQQASQHGHGRGRGEGGNAARR